MKKNLVTNEALKALIERKVTITHLAQKLDMSPGYLSRIMKSKGYALPPGATVQARINASRLAETRQQHRALLARQVIAKDKTLEEAAKAANCSSRTMYRHVNRLQKQT